MDFSFLSNVGFYHHCLYSIRGIDGMLKSHTFDWDYPDNISNDLREAQSTFGFLLLKD